MVGHPWSSEAATHRMWEVPILPWTAKNRPRQLKGKNCGQYSGYFSHIDPLKKVIFGAS
jgi:hypothetical protein